jgi:hypothetical protein
MLLVFFFFFFFFNEYLYLTININNNYSYLIVYTKHNGFIGHKRVRDFRGEVGVEVSAENRFGVIHNHVAVSDEELKEREEHGALVVHLWVGILNLC